MSQLLGFLCGFACLLAVVTVVGHGLWLALAAMFGKQEGKPRDGEGVVGCPRCGSTAFRVPGGCRSCGFRTSPSERGKWQLEATERQLRALRTADAIDEAEFDRLTELIRAERVRLQTAPGERPDAEPVEPTTEAEATEWKPLERRPRTVRQREAETPVESTDSVELVEEQAAPLPQQAVVPTPAAPAERVSRRSLADLLQAFMEEKNIRWGEVVSGMLIVGSAVGLVISLWSTLTEAIPYFPSLIFMLLTAAIHGAGLYTLRRWKLKSTSQGLLVISTLLVPLNFLAAIALTQSEDQPRPASDPWYIAAVIVGLVSYGAISWSSGRAMLRRHWWPFFAVVMGPSAAQLLFARVVEPGQGTWLLIALAVLPLSAFLAGTGSELIVAGRGLRFSQLRAGRTFLVLGVGVFSFALSMALQVWETQRTVATPVVFSTLADLTPVLSLAAVMVLSSGLLVQQRSTERNLAEARTAGTWIALLGAVALLGVLILAWPHPDLLVAVGLIDFLALTALAVPARLPVLHAVASGALALVGVVALQLIQGRVSVDPPPTGEELFAALLLGRSAALVCIQSLLTWLAAMILQRRGRAGDAWGFRWGTVVLAVYATIVAWYSGFWTERDGALATPILAVYGAAVIAVSGRVRRVWVTTLGSGLVMAALLHALLENDVLRNWLRAVELLPRDPTVMAALLHASIVTGAAILFRRQPAGDAAGDPSRSIEATVTAPLAVTALLTSAVVLPVTVWVESERFAAHGGYLLWTAIVWGLVAVLQNWRPLFVAAQGFSALGLAYLVAGVCRRQPWTYVDPRHWQAQISVLAIWSIAWLLVYRRRLPRMQGLMAAPHPAFRVEHLGLLLCTAGVIVLTTAAVIPGVTGELSAATRVSAAPMGSPESEMLMAAVLCVALVVIGLTLLNLAVTCRETALAGLGLGLLSILFIVMLHVHDPFEAVRTHAFGPGSWAALGLAAAGVVIGLRERYSDLAMLELVALLAAVPLIIAGLTESSAATASMLRWGLAVLAVVVAVVAGIRMSGRLERLGFAVPDESAVGPTALLRSVGTACTSLPVLALTLIFLGVLFGGHLPRGPAAGSVFADLGLLWSYAVPLGVTAAALMACGGRDRRPLYMLIGSFVVQFAVLVVFLVPRWSTGIGVVSPDLATLASWYGIVLGVCTLVWSALRAIGPAKVERNSFRSSSASLVHSLLPPHSAPNDRNEFRSTLEQRPLIPAFEIQLMLTIGVASLPPLVAAGAIIGHPQELPVMVSRFGQYPAYLSVLLAVLAGLAYFRRKFPRWGVDAGFITAAAMATLIAASLSRSSHDENWLSYRVLTSGFCAIAIAGTVTGWGLSSLSRGSPGARVVGGSSLIGIIVVLLATRAIGGDPDRPDWSVMWVAAIAACAAGLALRGRSQPFAYASVLLTVLGAGFAWLTPWLGIDERATPQSWVNLGEAVVIAAVLAGIFWLVVEVVCQRQTGGTFDLHSGLPPVHHVVAPVALALFGAMAVACLGQQTTAIGRGLPTEVDISNPGGWILLGCLAALLAGSVADLRAAHVAPWAYALGLLGLVVSINDLRPTPRLLWFDLGVGGAIYVLLTGVISTQSAQLGRLAASLSRVGSVKDHHRWLTAANLLLAVAVCVIGFRIVLTYGESHLRLWMAASVALLLPAVACLALGESAIKLRHAGESVSDSRRSGDRPAYVKTVALMFAVVAAVDFGWAVMPPLAVPVDWVPRSIRLLEVLAAMTFVYGVGLVRLVPVGGRWFAAARNAATLAGLAAIVSLLAVLYLEGVWFARLGKPPVTDLQVAIVATVLVLLAAALISLVILPGRDPLNLTDRGRMLYVYAAEVILSLLFLHIRLTKPEFFHGRILPYWPFIVMLIAFCGVGIGELFDRRKMTVLSEPLRRTGVFLPLLPAIGYWITIGELSPDRIRAEYSTVLFVVGLLYIAAAMWRRSFLYGALAGLAGNGALWALLSEQGFEILAHPQMWLIPPAVCVLGAAQINRDRLSEMQLASIRYAAVSVIYVSSTGEMFLQGIGQNLWLPIVLALLSIAGVFAGILLQVRAFLYLGTAFLLLSLVSMVWHAQRNIGHVWPWWAFGIASGLAILTLFGVFEKKRNEVLGVLRELRHWEA